MSTESTKLPDWAEHELRLWAVIDRLRDQRDELRTELAASRATSDENTDRLLAAAVWSSRLWWDWPQARRDAVRALSAHLADAMEAQAVLVRDHLSTKAVMPPEEGTS